MRYPKWNSVCLPFLPFPFFPPPAEDSPKSSSKPLVGVALPEDPDQALAGDARRSSQRTVPRVRPAMRTLGLGAVGRAGKASALFVFAGAREELGVGREEGLMVLAMDRGGGGAAAAHGVADAVDLGAERAVAAERGGKGLVDDDEDDEGR